MPNSTHIATVHAREVLDSRGNPTVEVDISLQGGATGRAIVPSGASTGRHEAVELRDGDPGRYEGKGVLRAVAAVNDIIAPAISGTRNPTNAADQKALDTRLCELDGTTNKSNLGANAILGVSLAAAHAAARAAGLPLYRYLGGDDATTLPMPMVNIISGGRHAEGGLDMQDFLAIPIGAATYREALRMAVAVHRAIGRILTQTGPYGHGVADEGGYGPPLPCHEDALGLLHDATRLAGYRCARNGDIAIGLDVAATEFVDADGRYPLRAERRTFSATELTDLLVHWCGTYPIISIEDGVAEDDWDGWEYQTEKLGASTQLVGDDLFTTNPQRLTQGADRGIANSRARETEPDWHPDRNPGNCAFGETTGLPASHFRAVWRNRRHHNRRPGRGHRSRPDQNWLNYPLRAPCQVQPTAAHRRRVGRTGAICRAGSVFPIFGPMTPPSAIGHGDSVRTGSTPGVAFD